MELDFDKQIDALIRREGAARTITIGEFAGLHPDADEIAAFVENAVPANARKGLISHFAECDPCRLVLVNTIEVNADIVSPTPDGNAAPEVTAAVVPWYRRLFLFPQLAYVMGGLIVLFGGFIGFTVLTNYQNTASEVSQVRSNEQPSASAPAEPGMIGNANAAYIANTANTSAAAANAVSNSAPVNAAPAATAANTAANTAVSKDQNFALDGVSTQPQQPALAQPPPKNEPKPADKLNEVAENDLKAGEKEKKREEQSVMAKSAPAPAPRSPMKVQGPMRNESRDARAAETEVSRKRDDLPAAGRSSDPNRKQVSGKTFEFRQGAWFDTTYRGQGTITVRRNTEDYRKLDSGLRGIAESFFGTVVTIWNGKAYKIQ